MCILLVCFYNYITMHGAQKLAQLLIFIWFIGTRLTAKGVVVPKKMAQLLIFIWFIGT
jgi:hypothetical protein